MSKVSDSPSGNKSLFHRFTELEESELFCLPYYTCPRSKDSSAQRSSNKGNCEESNASIDEERRNQRDLDDLRNFESKSEQSGTDAGGFCFTQVKGEK